MSLFTELKRRNVFKVGAAYLVVGWIMVEVSSTVSPHMNLPEWAPSVVIFFVLIGFPLALVLAWIFDLTPDGVQITEGNTGSKQFYGIVAVIAAVALGWFLLDQPQDAATPVVLETAVPATQQGRPSIAVLAFDNMSPDAANAYFAEGISEEILNVLAGVQGLKVASRTSAFSFRGKDTPIPEIARFLEVDHVLEGSVRKQGERVRITAQLIHAQSDTHLWSASYDRDLTDIFAVQEEIAQAITTALAGVLGTRRITVEASTGDLEAYERFLRGRTNFYRRLELDQAIDDFEFATARDPGFADAWAFLAAARYVIVNGTYRTRHDRAVLATQIREPAERALALRPELPLALVVRGQVLLGERSGAAVAEALAVMQRAAAIESRDTTARLWLGLDLLRLGLIEEALPVLEQAYRADPMVAINVGYLGYAYFISGREREGMDLALRAVDISQWVAAVNLLLVEMANRGRIDEALALLELVLKQTRPPDEVALQVGSFARALEDPSHRPEYFATYIESGMTGVIAEISFGPSWMASARWPMTYEGAAAIYTPLVAWLPSTGWLRESHEFYRYAERLGFTQYWETHRYPMGCRAVNDATGRRLVCPARQVP